MARTKLQKIKQTRRYRWTFYSILIVGIILALLFIVAYLPFLRIKQVKVAGAVVVKAVEVESLVKAELSSSFLGVIPRDHFFWYPNTEIKTAIKTQFPKLNEVQTRLDWPTGKLEVKVDEREPVMIACLWPEAKDCFFLDAKGEAYSRAPHFSTGVFLEWRATSSHHQAPFLFASSTEVARILILQKLFKQVLEETSGRVWILPRVESLTEGDYVFMVNSNFASSTKVLPWKILVDGKNNPTDLALNLHTTLSSILATTSTSTWPKLQYVDLRFGKKVFYKL